MTTDLAIRRPRRPAVDVARVLALVIVVLGHLTMAVVDRPAGEIRGDNLFELEPGWAWLAVLAPMPVFFAAGGWANATSTPESSARRLASLVGTAAVAVAVWSVAVVMATAVNGSPGLVGRGARLATQPLWFLGAYVPLAASGSWLASLVARRPSWVFAAAFASLVAIDGLRYGASWPELVAWLAFPVAWAVPWCLGAWWRARAEQTGAGNARRWERRVGAALLVAGAAVGWALVASAGYTAPLIDVSDEARTNTSPPGLYTAVIGVAQSGVLMLSAAFLDRIGERWRGVWTRAGEAAVGIYIWHLTALSMCVGLVALGLPAPERLTALWWVTRPLWWGGVLAVIGALVVATAVARDHLRRPGERSAGRARAVTGVVVTAGGAALVGLVGPRSVGYAVACTASFAAGWWLLRGASPRLSSGRTRPGP